MSLVMTMNMEMVSTLRKGYTSLGKYVRMCGCTQYDVEVGMWEFHKYMYMMYPLLCW